MGLFNKFQQKDLPRESNPSSSNPDIRYLELVLKKWLDSKERAEQLLGDKYYDGHHDILERKKMVIGADGNQTELTNVINNKLIDIDTILI